MNRSASCHSRSFDQADGSIIHKREEHVADASWPFNAIMEILHGGGEKKPCNQTRGDSEDEDEVN